MQLHYIVKWNNTRKANRANPPIVDFATSFERCKYLNLHQENARARGSG